MVNIVAQASFNSGEWSPNLFARVDLAKYKSGAALLENFFVDYRGGASSRMGARYVLQAKDSAHPVRLIPFQAAFNIGYALEFGQNYIRFFYQGAPVLEPSTAITGVNLTNPVGIHVVTGWVAGDWIYVTGIVGTTQLNGNYYKVLGNSAGVVTLADLNGNPIDGTGYTAWASGGTAARIYTIASPYAGADLAMVKFTQVTNVMILCHPSYPPYKLTLITATNWTMSAVVFGSTATAPSGISVTSTLGPGVAAYSYGVTSIDSSGQESSLSTPVTLSGYLDIRASAGTNKITWTPSPGAQGYNVYESYISYFGVIPAGVNYGYIGTVKGTTFIDSNITPNFSESPPVSQNPFTGDGVASIAVSVAGTYTTVPSATISGGSPSIPAVVSSVLGVTATPTVTAGGTGHAIGDNINFGNGLILRVATLAGSAVATWTIVSVGAITAGSTPANPIAQVSSSGSGTGATATATWGVVSVTIINPGAGFGSVPSVVFGSGAAVATVTLGATSNGNPEVPAFCQQRLVLAAQPGAPQTFHMSQPGAYYNFDITAPVQASNAITETLVASTQETIKSISATMAGMLILTDKAVWLVNGGPGLGTPISATSIVANRHATVGASDVPPISINYSTLYVQSKGFSIREATFNIYYNTFASTDITVLASHLFFGYTVKEWAWAEQPFYMIWGVRSDGVLLGLTYLKEQEFCAWSHHTTNGLFQSVCTVTETAPYIGTVDAIYTVVQRVINGNTVQYIERMADRIFPSGAGSAWCVDAGVSYSGPPILAFEGAEHLALTPCVANCVDNLGNVTAQSTTPDAYGNFTLPAPPGPASGYTSVIIGLSFLPKLQTLAIDISQAPIQGKLKQIPDVVVRVNDTLGITIGGDFGSQIAMKDTVSGSVSSMLSGLPSQIVTGLVSGDARAIINASWTVPGQYCITQPNPWPATILGLFPHLIIEGVPD